MTLIELLNKIKLFPRMYFIEDSIDDLNVFLMGYFHGAAETEDKFADLFCAEFDKWLSKKYVKDGGIYRWNALLRFQTNGDSQAALNLFFENLEEFKKEYGYQNN